MKEIIQFTTAPKALAALAGLKREVFTVKTSAELMRILNVAEALRRAFKPVHSVANKAGEVSVEAEARLGKELKKLPLATGTRGQLRGTSKGSKRCHSGGRVSEPPESGPSLQELGVTKKRSTRSK